MCNPFQDRSRHPLDPRSGPRRVVTTHWTSVDDGERPPTHPHIKGEGTLLRDSNPPETPRLVEPGPTETKVYDTGRGVAVGYRYGRSRLSGYTKTGPSSGRGPCLVVTA